MNNKVKITYLLNSGFVLEMNECAMVFDYYQDPKNILPEILKNKQEIYFFVSHIHYDHFNPEINQFAEKVTKYFISYDVNKNLPSAEKTVILDEYTSYDDRKIHIQTFSSTDEGISFYIEKNNWKIFHAGDFNWWHWKGDTEENNAFAKNGFMKQLKRLGNLDLDVAFFPVDSRQEEFMDIGVTNFCNQVHVKNLITMHNAGEGKWTIPQDFAQKYNIQAIYTPQIPGETISYVR